MSTYEELELESLMANLELAEDPKTARALKLKFARVGIFDIRNIAEYGKQAQRMSEGIRPSEKPFWYMEKFGEHPLKLTRIHRIVEAKNRKNWRMIEIASPFQITPHAFARYKERNGGYISADQLATIPYMPEPPSFRKEDGIKKDYLVPYNHGAFLGFPAVMPCPHIVYEFKRGKLTLSDLDDNHYLSFYAMTFISSYEVRDDQQAIIDAFNAGDFEEYERLSK